MATVRIALASPRVAPTLDAGLAEVARHVAEAAAAGAAVVAFPEAYLPGLRGLDFDVPPFTADDQARALAAIAALARTHRIAIVAGMEWIGPAGRQIAAPVFDASGALLGVQTKAQLDPTEEGPYVPGGSRTLFETGGLRFGVAICHEAFRYPETVRWAARRGAHVVFHPHCTGSDHTGTVPTMWGAPDGPYYEKAMQCRALENTVYFASANYAFRYPESATSVIDPVGALVAHHPYGADGVLVADLDLDRATGLLARRYAPERYGDVDASAPG